METKPRKHDLVTLSLDSSFDIWLTCCIKTTSNVSVFQYALEMQIYVYLTIPLNINLLHSIINMLLAFPCYGLMFVRTEVVTSGFSSIQCISEACTILLIFLMALMPEMFYAFCNFSSKSLKIRALDVLKIRRSLVSKINIFIHHLLPVFP